ncbi:sensory rhodopsin transducer [Actinoplanes sp. NPDC026619]|uniref:sensory rhodopsin transducer n=1 Tax=Actinoplanes sp. NPDC026619 TaxID=3155798 RepID=UPI0033C22B50
MTLDKPDHPRSEGTFAFPASPPAALTEGARLGPYHVTVPGRRTLHQRFNDLSDPPVPRDTDYASVIRSDRPVVAQHTRLDSRQAENALMSTVAYPV